MSLGSRNSILRGMGIALLLAVTTPAIASQDCLTFVFQGSVEGYISDCGCPKQPLGGLPHRAAIMENVQASCENVLALDAGNMMGAIEEGMREQSAFLTEQAADLGIRTIGIGPFDLHFGLDFLRGLEQEHGVRFVSTNLLEDGEPAFPRYLIEERAGVRVGILSVMDPASELVDENGSLENLTIHDPKASILSVLPELRQQTDVIVLLSAMPRLTGHDLVRNLDEGHGIDFYIEGEGTRHYRRPVTIRGVKVLAANDRGKYVGELRLDLVDGQWDGSSEFELHPVDIKKPGSDEMAKRVADFIAAHEIATKSR